MRYAFILKSLQDSELAGLTISERCRILGVSTSGYYEWRSRELGRPCKKACRSRRKMISDQTIVSTVASVREELGYTPGYRQFHALLQRRGIRVSVKRLQRLL